MNDTILTTKRIRLEKIGTEHKSDLFALLSNPKVHKYFPKPLGRNESIAFFEEIQYRYDTDGYCFWAAIRKTDSIFLGICGLLSQVIDGQKETEVGYRLLDEFWGQGYGTEAAGGCIQYGKKVLKLASIISLIRPVNLPSIRVAEKNGLILEKETVFHNMRHLVYRINLNKT